MSLPRGLRIALTRSAEDNASWASALRDRGLVDLQVPCLTTEALHDQAAALRAAFERCDALLFTSPRAVSALLELAPELPLAGKPCACVGEASARAATKAGAEVQFLAPLQTALSLGQEWIERQPASLQTLWPCAEQARAELVQLFEAAARPLAAVPVYRTRACSQIDMSLAATADAIFFASPSAVEAMAAAGSIPGAARLISIGPSTSAALRAHGCSLHAQAQQRNIEGMLEALEDSLQSESSPK